MTNLNAPAHAVRTLQPLLVSVAHAALSCDVSEDRIRRQIGQDEILTVEVGIDRRKTRIRVSVLAAWNRARTGGLQPVCDVAHRDSMTNLTIPTHEGCTLQPLLVSVAGAALLLDVSEDHIRRLIKSKEIATVDVGIGRGKTRIRVSVLEAWIDSKDPALVHKGRRRK